MTTKKKLTRRGNTKRMPTLFYPKRYSVEVKLNDDGEGCTITRTNENFSAWELYGMLRLLMVEIEDQMRIKNDEQLKVD